MGYSHKYFSGNVQAWLDAGWLGKGQRLIEFGAQEFFSDPEETRREVHEFLTSHGYDPLVADGIVGGRLPRVHLVYEMLGIEYTAIDVDDALGSTFFDLNTHTVPEEWIGKFDFVNDEGTVEHLVNPINCFHVAHDLTKVGGVIRHSFPLTGWRDHGFLYPTTKFCAHMVGDNGYEVLQAEVQFTGHTPFDDPFFKLIDPAPPVTDLWAFLIYRKTRDQPFVIPVDHVGGDTPTGARRRLREYYDKFAKTRLKDDALA
jgi:hypothetical protein